MYSSGNCFKNLLKERITSTYFTTKIRGQAQPSLSRFFAIGIPHVRHFDQPKVATLVITQTADPNDLRMKLYLVALYGLFICPGWTIRIELGLIPADPELNSCLKLSII